MYVYELTAFEYSDAEHQLISHEKKFTRDDFKMMLKTAVNEMEKRDCLWVNMHDFIDILIEKFGFKRYRPEATVYVGGSEGYNVDYERGE